MLVAIDACAGPARGQIIFEAKNSQVPKRRALEELDEAMAQRDADYGVWVVPSDEQLPARTQPLREVNGDKLFVVYDPEEGRIALQVAYALARARVLMAKGDTEGLDASALRARSSARSGRSRRAAGSASSSPTPPTASRPRARSWTRWSAA